MGGTPSQCEEQAVEALLHAHGLTGSRYVRGEEDRHDAYDEVVIQLLCFKVTHTRTGLWLGCYIPRIKYNIRHKCYMIDLWPETLMQVSKKNLSFVMCI